MYLGGRLNKKEINGIKCWSISSAEYLKSGVKNVEEYIRDTKFK